MDVSGNPVLEAILKVGIEGLGIEDLCAGGISQV